MTTFYRVILSLLLLIAGCSKHKQAIVLYTSVDEPYVRPIIDAFTNKTGIAVTVVYDTEATKSVGLAERLRAEKGNARCDVFWGNEIFNTVLLADEGVFAPYDSPSAKDIRPLYRDAQNRWTAVGIRARVMATPARREAASILPHGLDDLLRPELKNKIALARPTAGTTGGQVAALYSIWGQAKADQFFHDLHANAAVLLGGNSDVANEVAAGNIYLGLTDNDDAANTIVNGNGVVATLPNQSKDDIGTLAVPTTVSLVARNNLKPQSNQLIDYLLSADTEQALIAAKFAGWSVRSPDTTFHAMAIDYAAVAKIMPSAIQRATAILEGR